MTLLQQFEIHSILKLEMQIGNISNEVIIIALCIFQFLCKILKKPKTQKAGTVKQQQQQQQKLIKDPELQQLDNRKKQIQSTIEQFNNPSTFAKYSKMQRQLVKINSRIKSINQNKANQNTQSEQKTKQKSKTQEDQKKEDKPEYLFPTWFGIFFNVVILSLALTMETKILPNYTKIPLSWVVNQYGRANCIFVYLACKMILF